MTVIALTGAAGRLGTYLRGPLAQLASRLISTDILEVTDLAENETYRQADLADLGQMEAALKGADVIVHFGAIGDEAPFEDIFAPNFVGVYNVWEAAYRLGITRVVYASSIHAVGMYSRHERIGIDAPHRPDSYYGLSKCFAENLAQLNWRKRGIEAVCLRILSCAAVTSERALGTWLSVDDLIQLVEKAITAPVTGFSIIYGVSDNTRVSVDNAGTAHLGYVPKDNAEIYAADVLASAHPDPTDPAQLHQGGVFASGELGQSGVALMGIKDERDET